MFIVYQDKHFFFSVSRSFFHYKLCAFMQHSLLPNCCSKHSLGLLLPSKERQIVFQSYMNEPTPLIIKTTASSGPGITELQQHASNFIMFLPHNFRSPDIGPPNLEICVLPAQLRGTW
ncbi:hypothetical protein CEXT_2381 [Caerostris extrusa]|uniref:Uncharacterized protein n=1 Tax=Caerostris extrusa TaxID=172846 RepID=A0AAV4Y0H2_CAEEX|nr:hypothetical protein CEXT_2381 [Caerostris extrusa]